MVANDDLEGKTTHFTGFYTHTISGPNIPKPPIVKSEVTLRVSGSMYLPIAIGLGFFFRSVTGVVEAAPSLRLRNSSQRRGRGRRHCGRRNS